MPDDPYKHIFLAGPTSVRGYTTTQRGGSVPRIPNRDRNIHSAHLQQRLHEAWERVDQRKAIGHMDRSAAYVEFVSDPDSDLVVNSLEDQRAGIRLLNIRHVVREGRDVTLATISIPLEKRGHFLNKINDYVSNVNPKSGLPRNQKLIDSVSDIRLAVLESFWQDDPVLLPGDASARVEVWLIGNTEGVVERFNQVSNRLQIRRIEGTLKFPERTVIMIEANRSQLTSLVEDCDDIAEFRSAKEIASLIIEMQNAEQTELVRRLLERTRFVAESEICVCLLDTGVNTGHLLIQPVLSNDDLHAVIPDWGTHDHDKHGTLMAGLAAYGDLLELLNSTDRIVVSHRLESAKILPPPPARNPKELWGYMTAQGLFKAEIKAPQRKRITCMAVASKDARDRGRPSSWSAKVDELASGYDEDPDRKRLIILSAGNVDDAVNWRNYHSDNLTNEIHDPGQSWNGLTVGAFTQKVQIRDAQLNDYHAIATAGGLSPYSTTSVNWPFRKWPIKPEILLEGGNIARGPNDSIFDTEDLKLISTYFDPQVAQFAPFSGTSAASAQAAWIAAQIQIVYPNAWPETVRALMVHSAEWTESLRQQFLPPQPDKEDYAKLLRICGYGVPKLDRALYCAVNSLTLISQAELQPFDKRENAYVTRDMHLYNLPWPVDALSGLAETQVKMRITLSYFIEPSPGEVGWNDRYRYPSHALRFDVNGPAESENEFIRRINAQARDEDGEHPGTEGPGSKWIIGKARNVGSIHSDIWKGTAAELAASNRIAIYPAVGWWKSRHHLNQWSKRCRYSLIVTIQTPTTEVDIYTPVAVQVGVMIPVEIPDQPQ